MQNAVVIIANFCGLYCDHHKATVDVLDSVSKDNPGIGTLETKRARFERILYKKADELAQAIWTD